MGPSVIRTAAPSDAAAIAALADQLGYPTNPGQARNRLERLLGGQDHRFFVACGEGGEVVGWIHVHVTRLVESEPFAELGGLVVAEGRRGRGHGRALIRAAAAWTMEKGIGKLRVRTRADRSEAHAFYEKLGFTLTKQQRIYDADPGGLD